MIKSVALKKILLNTVFRGMSVINTLIPKNDKVIMLYSNMGFRDNVKAIYDHLIAYGYNNKYHILISSNEAIRSKLPDNVEYISNLKGIFKYLIAGHVLYAFGKIPIYPSKNQSVVQMWHGTPFKAPDNMQLQTASNKSYYSKMLISSDYFREIVKRAQGVKDENIAICGQPRTDIMFRINERYPEIISYKKVIIWMPTFRKSSILGYSDVAGEHSVIPIFDASEYKELNEKLYKIGMLLIVKLHPLADIDMFRGTELSNLYLLSHDEFISKGWDLYRLIAQCDAMITDYSSVFYDFMLLDRPMAFTIDDYEDYKDGRGFAVDRPDYIAAGYKIRDKFQFYNFLNDVSLNKDFYAETRREVNRLVNAYNDGKQCERALKIANIN